MDYKRLIIRGISYSQTQTNAYALLLEHPETSIKLPVVIGSFEAQSISLGLEKDLKPSRPLTHDLFVQFMKHTDYKLFSVIIYQILDGVFFSKINVRNSEGKEISLDARTSDAVAMAVRFDAPILTTDQVLGEAGIFLELDIPNENNVSEMIDNEDDWLQQLPTDELERMLETAVKEEDFDTALEIQDEIKRRKK